jgi:hypothetical protein
MEIHHAYLCVGEGDVEIRARMDALEIAQVDRLLSSYTRMSIDDVRRLLETAYQAPLESGMRGIGIIAHDLPWQSQNGLLKLFEDPPERVVFFLSVPHEGMLLATLRSRLFKAGKGDRNKERGIQNGGEMTFMQMGVGERKKFVEDLIEEDDAKDRALALISECERALLSIPKTSEIRALLHDLLEFRRYGYGPSPSLKMMLLHLALALPVAR